MKRVPGIWKDDPRYVRRYLPVYLFFLSICRPKRASNLCHLCDAKMRLSHPPISITKPYMIMIIYGHMIAHPHLLVWATSERFLPTGGTFRVGLASESHWLQLVLVFTVHW